MSKLKWTAGAIVAFGLLGGLRPPSPPVPKSKDHGLCTYYTSPEEVLEVHMRTESGKATIRYIDKMLTYCERVFARYPDGREEIVTQP